MTKNTPLSLWWTWIKGRKAIYFTGVLSVALATLMQVLIPRLFGYCLDFLRGEQIWFSPHFLFASKAQNYGSIIGLIFISLLVLFYTRYLWRVTLARESHHSGVWLRKKIYEKAPYLSTKSLQEKFTVGNVMNLSTSDVNTSRYVFGFTLVAVADMIFLSLFALLFMFEIHPQMTLVTLGVFFFIPIAVKKLSSVEMSRYQMAQKYLSGLNDVTTQGIKAVRLQRLTSTDDFWIKRLEQSAWTYRLKRLSAIFTSLRYFPIMGSASMLTYVLLIFWGISEIHSGVLTVGEFVALQSLIFLIQVPLFDLGFIISEVQKARACLERLCELYNSEPESLYKTQTEMPSEHVVMIRCQGLSFRYDDQEPLVINNLSFELEKGQRLGIVGPIGSGKSTLVSILTGAVANFQGRCEFLGTDIRQVDRSLLKESVALVPQTPFLFAETIRNNIKLDLDMTDEEIWKVLWVCSFDQEVKAFEKGLDTPLGEWGINLSGGQKQRLTLARALARKPQTLIFDDCLSAVDTVTEENILKRLDDYIKGITTIWVAHRKSTLKYCDTILEFKRDE